MAIYDFSKAPCGVKIINTSNKDKKISLSGHSQSFILTAGNSAILKAKTSSELIGYLSQLQDGIKVEFPGLPTESIPNVVPVTILGDYALGDRNGESEMFKDSIWEAEHMDILDQWYTLTYSFDGGQSSTALLKGMLGVDLWDMGFGEMDIMALPPYGDMAFFADEQVGMMILNAVVTPGDGGDPSITPSELVTTLVLENIVSGEYGAPSPNIGKIVSLESLVASEMNDLTVTATNCTVSVVGIYSSELVFEEGTDTLPTGIEVEFQITPAQGYTTDGMTFLVNGVATDITSSLVVSGDVTITATAVKIP